ncbi:hypothetical protein [Sessilibacter corallicola]|uniref:hypothetical protein n=1 Tax=Sessilibacter corallicola TaxID=2904075 RepID=UPI001E51D35E|nr:hypothetical protein [Sessilibacter corallicola]MCE2030391.1 hypothetical protein [Sessilibacter corallicola]
MKANVILSGLCSFVLIACSSGQINTGEAIAPFINENEITGFIERGDTYESVVLEYSLDTPNGDELQFASCPSIENTSESNVDTSQFYLLQLIKKNCIAAKYYYQSLSTPVYKSYLPNAINEEFIVNLPATTVPDLGGQFLEQRSGILKEFEEKIEVLSESENSIELALSDDLVINYVVMARGDFNKDGIEDMILRLDWYISSAFGKGFELVSVTQKGEDKPYFVGRL